jgi:hypothetical protein
VVRSRQREEGGIAARELIDRCSGHDPTIAVR